MLSGCQNVRQLAYVDQQEEHLSGLFGLIETPITTVKEKHNFGLKLCIPPILQNKARLLQLVVVYHGSTGRQHSLIKKKVL